MPRLIGGPEKAHDADVTIAAHAENHYAISCIKSKISQVSNYKMSITLLIKKMSWSSQKLSTRKFNQNI